MSVPTGEERTPAQATTPDALTGLSDTAAVQDATVARKPWSERFTGRRSRRATYVLLVGIGIELGMAGAFLSLQVLHLLGVALPVGPLVAVAGNLIIGLWAMRITGNRSAAVAPAAGWLATVLLLSSSRSEGDLVITNSGRGVAFLLLGALAWAAAAAGGRVVVPAQPN